MTTVLGWHFTASDRLPHGDGRKIILGKMLSVKGKIIPCQHGLHFSVWALDALKYAPGPILWRTEGSGTVVTHGDDKYAASKRKAIAGGKDASEMLRVFARQCALDVIHLWKAPDVVRQYLETGDESLRDAAGYAAWTPVYAARGAATTDAAEAAGWATGGAPVYAAAHAAWSAAWSAATDAATDAARAAQRTRFEAMCDEFVR